MATRPFRFIHASDFHLEQPLMGVAEVPDHLRELFLDAPYTAAAQTVRGRTGRRCRVRAALRRRPASARHRSAGTARFWWNSSAGWPNAGSAFTGRADSSIRRRPGLPRRCCRKMSTSFRTGRVEELTIQCDGEPLAHLAGTSRDRQRPLRPADFAADPAGLYSIAVAHGDVDAAALQARGIHYWALGGRHDRSTLLGGPQTVHYCGSPQGRRPEENGIHGCTLVEVDAAGQTRTSLITTDAGRWMSERIAVDETTSREELETRLRDRLHALVEASPGWTC